jgi:hypothetical protein
MPKFWPEFFTPTEVALYDLLIDFPIADPWHIRDLLVDLNLEAAETNDKAIHPTLEVTSRCLKFVNKELKGNPEMFPSEILRDGRYPLIRQMRDVHEFDVGSHLAYCHALAIRRGSIDLLRDRGFTVLIQAIEQALEDAHPSVASTSSVFHDFFKCFRRRRLLPSKIGSVSTVKWRMPDGTDPDSALAADEERIAVALLPHFIEDKELCAQVQRSVQVSGEVGRAMYDLLVVGNMRDANAVATEFWAGRSLDRDELVGIFIGAVDWLGKGYAQHLVTARKRRKRSLEEAGTILYGAGEQAIRG